MTTGCAPLVSHDAVNPHTPNNVRNAIVLLNTLASAYKAMKGLRLPRSIALECTCLDRIKNGALRDGRRLRSTGAEVA